MTISIDDALKRLRDENILLGSRNEKTGSLSFDRIQTKWDQLKPGDTILLYRGVSFDPHSKAKEIIAKKPGLIIAEQLDAFDECNIPVIQVKNGRSAWSVLMNALYGDPARNLKLIGVTGTNGKTSTVWFIKKLLESQAKKVCSIGTLGAFICEDFVPTNHTTPDPDILFSIFEEARNKGCEFIVMETSSHSIYQEKLRPLRFAFSAFTNFTQDHLDLHGTMEEYFACKLRLFTELSKDAAYKLVHDSVKGHIPGKINYYGPMSGLTFNSRSITGTSFKLEADGESRNITTNIVGSYFCENLAAAVLIVKKATGYWPSHEVLMTLPPVPGRLERVSGPGKGPHVFVDYAHTPDAIEKSCLELKSLSTLPLTIVFGCGGNRDKGKRPKMFGAAAELADKIIVTSDNPRDEDPETIIRDILAEASTSQLSKTVKIADRRAAIFEAIQKSEREGLVLIAGKGHEDYQIIGGIKHPFDDRLVAAEALQRD